MGTPLPPNEPGQPCALCFGAGQPFGAGDTPKFITLSLEALVPGQFWIPEDEQLLLTPHLLSQTGIACSWSLEDRAYQWFVLWRAVGNLILVRQIATFQSVFSSFDDDPCLLEYSNDNDESFGNVAFGGKSLITWNPEGLS